MVRAMVPEGDPLRTYLERPSRRRLARVVDAYHSHVWNVALRVTGNKEDAADILQDVFLGLLLDPPPSGRIRSSGGYLAWRVVTLAGRLRRAGERRRRREIESWERASAAGVAAADADALQESIALLPEELRVPIELHYLAGLKNQEVAELLGLPLRTLEHRLEEARDDLRRRLKPLSLALFLPTVDRDTCATPTALVEKLQRMVSWGRALEALGTSRFVEAMLMKKLVAVALAIVFLVGGGALTSRLLGPRLPGKGGPVLARAGLEKAAPGDPGLGRPAAAPPLEPSVNGQEGAGARPALLHGIVLEPSGQPAAEARVEAYPVQADWDRRAENPPAAVCDAGGSFRFGSIGTGLHDLFALSPEGGFALARAVEVPAPDPVVLQLEEGRPLEVLVTGPEEVPLSEAAVTLFKRDQTRAGRCCFDDFFRIAAVTDAGGRVFFPGLPEGPYAIRATKTGYFDGDLMVHLPVDRRAQVALEPGAYLAGRAYLRDLEHPLRQGQIMIYQVSPNGYSGNGTITGSEGEFTSHTLSSGTGNYVFGHLDFQAVRLELTTTHEAPTRDLVVVFRDGIRVKGVLRNLQGEPIPQTELHWRHSDELHLRPPRGSCKTDAEGKFDLSGLRPGLHRVLASDGDRSTELRLSEEAVQEVDLRIDLPVAVRLRVEGPDGQPAEGADVYFRQTLEVPRAIRMRHWRMKSGKDGYCILAGAERRGLLEVAASNDGGKGYLSVELEQVEPRLTVRLLAKGKISCTVVDASGTPVPGAIVVPHYPTGEFATFVGELETDSEGRFELASYPGEITFQAKHGIIGVGSMKLVLEPGENREVSLSLNTKNAIRGQVLDNLGKPLNNVPVSIHSGDRPVETMDHMGGGLRTDSEGRFAARVEDGVYTLKVRPDVEPAPAPVPGVMPGGPPIVIRVQEPSGKP